MLWRARVEVGNAGGSGTLVTRDLVLTCAHLVQGLRDPNGDPAENGGAGLSDKAYVTFPGKAEGLPATLYWRGAWKEQGNLHDIAVLRLDRPAPESVPECVFDAIESSLRPKEGEKSVQIRGLGFPPTVWETGTHVTLRTSIDRVLKDEWLEVDVEKAHLQQLSGGFSGAAVYLPENGAVVGMLTDAILKDGRGPLGKILPLDTIRRHWEELDDLLDLDWLEPEPRRELRLLVAGAQPEKHLRIPLMKAFPDLVPRHIPESFSSVWDAIRFVGEEVKRTGAVATFLRELAGYLPDPPRSALLAWCQRHFPQPAEEKRLHGSIVVRAVRLRDQDLHMVCYAVHNGRRMNTPPGEPVPADAEQIRTWVEAKVAEQIPLFTNDKWMVEFVVPRGELMSLPFDEWSIREGDEEWPVPMRTKAVVVRDVGRLDPGSLAAQAWPSRWQTILGRGFVEIHSVDCTLNYGYEHFYSWLDGEADIGVLAYASHPKAEWLAAALRSGIPIMLWHRADCPVPHPPDSHRTFLETLTEKLSTATPDQVPAVVMKLRKEAWSPVTGGADHCARTLTLLWDDPDRDTDPPLMMGSA
ncbi:MAG: trypsin-like peptidase domain-containing protein [Catenulispora sp.]|nr:trypsin-like peptidase domain-containing protein [Catenulispora sp.]